MGRHDWTVMTTPTYAELLETAKQGLSLILSGQAAEWSEGGHRVKVHDPDKMIAIIERLERLAAAEAGSVQVFRPLV